MRWMRKDCSQTNETLPPRRRLRSISFSRNGRAVVAAGLQSYRLLAAERRSVLRARGSDSCLGVQLHVGEDGVISQRADHARARASLQEPVAIQGVWLDASRGRIKV